MHELTLHSMGFWDALVQGLAAAESVTSLTTPTEIDLGYARFRGGVNTTWDTTYYYGLRYASPPEGHLRFRAPQPIENGSYYNNTLIVDSTKRSIPCVQGAPSLTFTDDIPGQRGIEDCLLLDILVPTKPKGSTLPVLESLVRLRGRVLGPLCGPDSHPRSTYKRISPRSFCESAFVDQP